MLSLVKFQPMGIAIETIKEHICQSWIAVDANILVDKNVRFRLYRHNQESRIDAVDVIAPSLHTYASVACL